MNTSRQRILIVLHETGYFRFYGSTILELARRGWDVKLAFDRPDKRGRPGIPEHAPRDVVSLGALPEVPERWISTLRSAVDYCRYLEAPFRDATYLRRRWEKTLPSRFRFLTRIPRLPRAIVGLLIRSMRRLEQVVRHIGIHDCHTSNIEQHDLGLLASDRLKHRLGQRLGAGVRGRSRRGSRSRRHATRRR